MGFVFFDLETTGLRLGFDQIIQFAAVRTDENLNEIARFEKRCRIYPCVIPHPRALFINGVHIDQVTDRSLPTCYEMLRDAHEQLGKWSPAIFVGYNSIKFDEEVLRYSFYQALLPVYLTSLQNNSRADILYLALAAAALNPGAINVPLNLDGKRSFKLEHIAPANGAAPGNAHDAMADVVSTLHLARTIKTGAPDVWNNFVRFAKKATVADFIGSEDTFLLTEYFANTGYHTPVVVIGNEPENPNGRFCLNLLTDPSELDRLPDSDLKLALRAKPSPIRRVKVNAAPTVTSIWDVPSGILTVEASLLEERGQWVRENSDFRERLIRIYLDGAEPWPKEVFVEKRLYENLFPREDERRLAHFHSVPWEKRLSIVESLDDERLRTLGYRLIYWHRRSLLPKSIQQKIEKEFSDRLAAVEDDERLPLSIINAVSQVDVILAETPNDSMTAYKNYLSGRLERLRLLQLEQQ